MNSYCKHIVLPTLRRASTLRTFALVVSTLLCGAGVALTAIGMLCGAVYGDAIALIGVVSVAVGVIALGEI